MAGKRIIHVNRDLILTSDRCRQMSANEKAGYLTSLCLLARSEEKNALRGCLCVGNAPMTVEEWCQEVGFERYGTARETWQKLFDRELFEWVDAEGRTVKAEPGEAVLHSGKRFVRVARFGENQDRLKRKERREHAENVLRSCRDSAENVQRKNTPPIEPQGVTAQNSGKSPQEPNTTYSYPSPNGEVTTNTDRASDPSPPPKRPGELPPDVVQQIESVIANPAIPEAEKPGLIEGVRRRYQETLRLQRQGKDTRAGDEVRRQAQEAQERAGRSGTHTGALPDRAEQMAMCHRIGEVVQEEPRMWWKRVQKFSGTVQAWAGLRQDVLELESEVKRRPDRGRAAVQNPAALLNAKLNERARRLGLGAGAVNSPNGNTGTADGPPRPLPNGQRA